jgi:hypothetical protein
VVACWIRLLVVTASNLGPVEIHLLLYAASLLLFYTAQRIAVPELRVFRRYIIIHHCMMCCSLLTSLFVRYVGITDCSKLKTTNLG